MKVQGAVSLQALISRDGTIQELQILSGPTILAAAAREAVKQCTSSRISKTDSRWKRRRASR